MDSKHWLALWITIVFGICLFVFILCDFTKKNNLNAFKNGYEQTTALGSRYHVWQKIEK